MEETEQERGMGQAELLDNKTLTKQKDPENQTEEKKIEKKEDILPQEDAKETDFCIKGYDYMVSFSFIFGKL